MRHLRLTSKCGLIAGAALTLSFTAAPFARPRGSPRILSADLHASGGPPR